MKTVGPKRARFGIGSKPMQYEQALSGKTAFYLALIFFISLAGCGIRMDGIQVFDEPMFENNGYDYGEKFYIFEDDIADVRIIGREDGAYKISLHGKEGWITRLRPYYKPDMNKWRRFANKVQQFERKNAPTGNPSVKGGNKDE